MFFDSKLNKLIRSVVALGLILTLLITATYTWLSNSTSTKMDASEFITISADAGLNMNYGYGDNNQGTMEIPKDCVLTECSSTDGKNLFFPLSAYGSDGDRDFTDGIEYVDDFIYREATGLDKNRKYISLDLELSSETDSSVWLSKESYIKNKSTTQTSANAVRIAFIEKEVEGKSVVFDNSPLKADSLKNFDADHYKPIGYINRDGTGPSTVKKEEYRPHAFNEYTSNNSDKNVLFNLKAGITKHITVNIWLEGTDPDCTTSVLNIDDLDILVKFTTSYEATDLYYFKDYTLEEWVEDDNSYICAVDANININDIKSTDLIPFDPSNNYENGDLTWFGEIPAHISNVRFLRLNPDNVNASHEEWNYWDAGELGECKTYNAFGHSAGMWAENFSPTEITLFDGTPNAKLLSNVHENNNSTTPHIMHVSFELEDGNGNMSSHNYKLSYHKNRAQWQIHIPSQATNINFLWYNTKIVSGKNTSEINDTTPDKTWQTSRTDESYYTAYFNSAEDDEGAIYATTETGYWSDELIYLSSNDDFEYNYRYGDPFIAYFFEYGSTFNAGVAMHAKTDSGKFKVAVPPELMKSNTVDANPDTTTVYFTNTNNWSTPNVHCWETVNGTDNALTTWPGITMTKSHKNGYGQDIYKAEIPANATGLLFSDNGSINNRTNDVRDVTLYDGIGFYVTDNKNYGTYTNYPAAVIFALSSTEAQAWHWDSAWIQTPDRLATYGTNNMFTISGADEDEWCILGDWSYESNP